MSATTGRRTSRRAPGRRGRRPAGRRPSEAPANETTTSEAPANARAGRETRRKPPARRRRRIAGWGLVVVAVLFLGWSAWAVRQDDPGARTGAEHTRDVVLRSARQQIAALNTMNPAQVDAGLRAWLDASTGPLHDQLERDAPQNRAKIGKSRTTAAATVTGAAVTSLDVRAGKAKVIASVQVKLTLQGGSPTLQRKRFEAGTARTPSGWRLESLTAVPVGAR